MVSSIFLLKNIKQQKRPLAASSPGVLGLLSEVKPQQEQSQRSVVHKTKLSMALTQSLFSWSNCKKPSDKAFFFCCFSAQ